MKTSNKALMYDAVSEMIQLHAFDHLLVAVLSNLKNVLNQWVAEEYDIALKDKKEDIAESYFLKQLNCPTQAYYEQNESFNNYVYRNQVMLDFLVPTL